MWRWSGRPLLGAGPERRWAAIALAWCAVVVVALGVLFAHQRRADGVDRRIDEPIVSWLGPHHTLLGWMEYPGTQVPAVVVSLALVLACLLARRLNGAILAVTAVFIATRIDDWLLKPLFDRTYLGALVYPSGHTSSMVAITVTYALLFVIPPQQARTRPLRLAGLAVLLAITVITVLGVIGLRWHYFTDTIGGAAVAIGTVCALALALDWAAARLIPARAAGRGSPGPG
jgi:membrane-associated phospholipid phosphatase